MQNRFINMITQSYAYTHINTHTLHKLSNERRMLIVFYDDYIDVLYSINSTHKPLRG